MDHLRATLASALNIRPGEGRSTALLLMHSFCLGTATVSFSTAASALFLATFDVGTLPYVYISSAVTTVLLGFLYTKLQARLPAATLLPATLVFLVLIVAALRLGLWLSASTWLAFALLFWLRLVIVLANLEFWGLAGRLFNVRQGKRLFSLIGSGELTASILGGFATPLLVMWLGTPNLLLITITGLLLALVFLIMTLRSFADQLTPPQPEVARPHEAARSDLSGLLKNPYIMWIILSNALMVIVYNFVDYTFYDFTKARYQDEMHLAIFIGPFFAVVQIINVLTKTFFSSRLFSRYGLGVGLLAHPLLLITGMVLITLGSSGSNAVGLLFWLVASTKLGDEVLWTSIYDPSLLILYQPLRTEQRRAFQVAVQSIFGPLAIGLSGVILLLLGTTDFFTSVHLTYIMLPILIGAIIVARRVSQEYPKALTQALAKRHLEGIDLSLQDGSSIAVLQQKLHSPHPGEIGYALDMLAQIEHESLPAFLLDLLEHPQADVRQDVLRRLELIKAVEASSAVRQRIDSEEVPQVRAAALRAWCALGDTEVVEQVTPYLHDTDQDIRLGAMVGLLRYGGIEGVLAAGEQLILAAHAAEPARRIFAAQGLGEVGIQSFYQPLVALLHDADPAVRRTAVTAAGKIQNPKLWPLVLDHLLAPDVGTAAVSALVAGGASVLPELAAAFNKPGQDRGTLVRMARICGRIRGERAIALLQEHIDIPDVAVRNCVLVALGLCGYRAQDGGLEFIQQQIAQEVGEATWTLAALTDIGEGDAIVLLQTALHHELDAIRRRLFLLLSFIYERQSIQRAWENLAHASTENRAYALEIIDVLLPLDLKTMLLALIDDLSPAQRLDRLTERFPQPSQERSQRLEEIVTRPGTWTHPWTRACALYAMAKLDTFTAAGSDVVVGSLSNPEPLIRESALWALEQLDPTACRRYARELYNDPSPQVAQILRHLTTEEEGHEIMLTTIEKVLILKTVNIFTEVPDEILAEVASLLDEVELSPGETVFEKGDVANCLYIIVGGTVRVHDGGDTIRYLGARDLFGELALLDAEPRSASITATDDTRLFRLDQDAFYELMADRIEVARGIIRVLCQQVRAATASTWQDSIETA